MEAGTGPPYHRADGGQEPRSIATCKKDTSLEMMTSWNERCSSPPDLSPAKAGRAEGNPLLPLPREGGEWDTEGDEPAHGGRGALPSPSHGAARLAIARHPTEGCRSVWPNEPSQNLRRGGSQGSAGEEQA